MPTDTWNAKAKEMLQGRTIVSVRYMTATEMRAHGWSRKAVVMTLDNGARFYPSSDDEGNEAGALFTSDDKHPTLPVIEREEKRWNPIAKRLLEGRKVVEVRYMNSEEQEGMGWFYKPVVMFFEDGSYVYSSKDDEGNEAGALFCKDGEGLPVLRGD